LCSQPGEPPLRAEESGGKHVGHEDEGIVAYLRGAFNTVLSARGTRTYSA
jgi:hypothetical protein